MRHPVQLVPKDTDRRQRQLQGELARSSDATARDRLLQQIKELEAARRMESWLRADLHPPA